MNTIAANLQKVRAQIVAAANEYGRADANIELVAATKTRDVNNIDEAVAAGQLMFGESYVQEAIPKITALALKHKNLIWHYIGRIQSNKIKYLAKYFAWVQSVTCVSHAEQLSVQRAKHAHDLPPLQICLEINLSAESSKTGIAANADEILVMARAITQLPHLKLRGLMAIPAPVKTFAAQHDSFKALAHIYYICQGAGLAFDTLSMGMTDDFVAAIAAGATMVRIGTAIFGPRV